MLLPVLALVVGVIYLLWQGRREKGEPRRYSGYIPLLGHVHKFYGDTTHLWSAIKQLAYECLKNDHLLTVNIGFKKVYVLTHPDDCLIVASKCFEKDNLSYNLVKPLFGDGLLFGPVSVWKHHRKLLNPAFNQQVLDGFLSVLNSQARKLVGRLEAEVGKGPFDQTSYLRQYTLETTCLTTMGLPMSEYGELNKNYIKTFQEILNIFASRFTKFWLHIDYIFNQSNLKKKQDEKLKFLRDMSNMVISVKRKEFKNKVEIPQEQGIKFKPFMDTLMENQEVLSDKEIREEVDNVMAAGHESSSNIPALILLLLGSHPKAQERAAEEIKEIFGDSKRDVEKADLARLVYLEAVIKEGMRFWSTIPLIGRYLDTDIKIRNYTLRAGNNCFLLLYGIHRHPMWGPDVEEFKPERWLDPSTLPANPNAYAAFGIGKRNCIAKNYAMAAMKMTISHILREYRLKGGNPRNVKTKLDILLKPASGFEIAIEKRL